MNQKLQTIPPHLRGHYGCEPYETIDATVSPVGQLNLLTREEIGRLLDVATGRLYPMLRGCALAVMNAGNYIDDGKELLERFQSFDIKILQKERGIKVQLTGAPASAFVDGRMIRGINEHLFAVLRDVVYANDEIHDNPRFDLNTTDGITDAVFHMLRNARILRPGTEPSLVVCWGGHSISQVEYDYSKEVGYQMGLRGLDICTGCGPGAMKGPMKGAAVGHAKQRITRGRYLGISEPGIIAAESPNPIVNELAIMPDIEKRLEAFVRVGHGIVIFPGGVGTAEEILYILGVLLHPSNRDIPLPVVFTGPSGSADYFEQIDAFIADTLGPEAQKLYTIAIDDPARVAKIMSDTMKKVRQHRRDIDDAYYFNWQLHIEPDFQKPFIPTHENMHALPLHRNQATHMLAANLRRAFSGIVAGNVKEEGIRAIETHGHFELRGDSAMMASLDDLLSAFAAQNRMKFPGKEYVPCYRIVKD